MLSRRKAVPLVALTLVLAVALPLHGLVVQAQPPVRLNALTISLWPEYDREGVLVIYRGVVSEDIPLPVTLTLHIPKTAHHIGGTAGVDAEGQFRYYRPTIVEGPDAVEVSYATPYRVFQFEFYDAALDVDGATRDYPFAYTADFDIGVLTFDMQEPAGSSDFSATPPGVLAADPLGTGLPVQRWVAGAAEAGETFGVQVTYTKTDPRLSHEVLGLPTPSTSAYEDNQGLAAGNAPGAALPLGLALAAGAGGFAMAYLLARRRADPAAARPAPQVKAKRRAASPKEGQAAASAFCRQCGHRLGADDRFCPQCGTRRRGA
ncbi:MAG: zinc ribbon domain-containing protein [Chloroflexi bacterium]|nr:zinc ribbon domain-containing protein [Chloroflexota bacterium]